LAAGCHTTRLSSIFSSLEFGGETMKLVSSKLSVILTFILLFQLINPITNVLAVGGYGAPANVKIALYNTNDIYLTWDSVSGAERYRVYRLIGEKKELVSEGINTYWWKQYAAEGIYNLAVTTVKYGIESELSPLVNFEIVYPKIGSPSDLSYSLSNTNDLQLKWSPVFSVKNYNIYQTVGTQKKLVSTTINTTSSFRGLPEGDYLYEVYAVSERFGESKESSKINISIVFPDYKGPELTSTLYDINNVNLVWKPVLQATTYKVYQIIDDVKKIIATTTNTSSYIPNLPEGEYIYEVTAVSDRLGETKENNRTKLLIVYPKINAPSNLKSTLHDFNNISLVWDPVDHATSYKIYHIFNNEKKLINNTTEKNYYVTNLPAGEHLFEVSAISNRFGESKENNQTKSLITYPELSAPEELIGLNEGYDGAYLEWKRAENASSYNIYEVINGEKKLLFSTVETSKHLLDLEEGEHIYEVSTVNNKFGESSNNPWVVIKVEYKATAPTVQLQLKKSNNVKISWVPIKYSKYYNIYEIKNEEPVFITSTEESEYNFSDLPDGVYEFAVSAVSNYFGESQISNIVTANLITAPTPKEPKVTGDKVEIGWSPVPGAESYNIYKVEEDGKVSLVTNTKSSNLTLEDLTPGDYEYRIVPVSPSGVEGEKYAAVLVEIEQTDLTPPQTVANETNNWLQVGYEIKLTATDDQSGVAKTFYSLNESEFTEGTSVTVTEEGQNTVSFYSVDNAGNVEEVKTTEVKIDKTAPVTKSDIASNWNKGKVTVNLTATDNLSGVAKTFYSVNGSAFNEGNTFTISTDGITQVSYYSVDNASNKEEAIIEEVMIDIIAPVTVSDISDQWNRGFVTVNLTATDNLSGVAKTYYSINGSEYFEGTSFTVTGDGVNQISFYSVDNAGNKEVVKTEFTKFDNQAPETVSDVTDKWNTSDVSVNLTATDNQSGVAKTFYSVNGSEYTEGTEFTVNHEGINKVSFYSVDNVGNVEEIKTVEVKIDKTAPKTVSDNADKWHQNQVTVNLVATDDLSGVAKTYYSINGSDFLEGTQFTLNEEGINKVSFYSVDNAGNIEEVQTVEVKVDKTAPVVSWDLANQISLGSSLPIAYKATDEHSGIAKQKITVDGKVYEITDSVKLDKPGTYEVVVTITDHAGWTTILEKTIEVYIPATLIVNPGVIKANAGDFTVKISLPKGYNTNQIDLSTATLNGVSAKSGTNGLVQQAKNGQFKFNRDDFEWKKGMVTVEFRVLIDGILVIGSTTVEVK
jgi:large repetitive protein